MTTEEFERKLKRLGINCFDEEIYVPDGKLETFINFIGEDVFVENHIKVSVIPYDIIFNLKDILKLKNKYVKKQELLGS